MKLIKFVKIMSFLTVVALVYINMQMQIFDLAYQAKVKEKQIHDLIDHNGQMTYSILQMKSSQHLGDKLLTEKSGLEFLDQAKVVQLKVTQPSYMNSALAMGAATEQRPGFLANLFALKAQAEASR